MYEMYHASPSGCPFSFDECFAQREMPLRLFGVLISNFHGILPFQMFFLKLSPQTRVNVTVNVTVTVTQIITVKERKL
jgi:hypothetical protein